MSELKRTPLYQAHLDSQGKMVPFAGWEMPVSYPAGIREEHAAVRNKVGMFDVSHMGRFRAVGGDAVAAMDYLVAGNVGAIENGKWLYTVLCNESGTVIDDLLVGTLGSDVHVVVNAANLQVDFDHMNAELRKKSLDAEIIDESALDALIAVQGPQSRDLLEKLLMLDLSGLKYYAMLAAEWEGNKIIVSRTGYTGELGYELYVPAGDAVKMWKLLETHGVQPCGLGSRDTLRLEVGYPLYGFELDLEHSPLESRLGWVIDLGKAEFIGREAITALKERGAERILVGLIGDKRVVPRHGYKLFDSEGNEIGEVASGTISPSLGYGIGTAFLPKAYAAVDSMIRIDIRGKMMPVRVVKPVFYTRGTARD